MSIRVLIVDDERLSRLKLRDFLEKEPDIDIVGEACSGPEAVKAVKKLCPDLVFLDVQMPELNGLEVAKALGPSKTPYIIFATAYDQYALQAFDVHALDYLLKPFDRKRFREALAYARQFLSAKEAGDELKGRLRKFLKDFNTETRPEQRFLIQSKNKMFIVKADEIEWVEAAGNYVILHTSRGEHLRRETMAKLESSLDLRQFVRANRSAIINLEFIKEIQPYFHGEFLVVLKNGQKIIVSRTFRERFRKRFHPQP